VRCTRLGVLGAIAPLLLISLASASPASAADGLTVQVVPESLTLVPRDKVDLYILLTNSTRSPVTITRVDTLGTPRVAARVEGLAVPTVVVAGGSLRTELELRAAPGVEAGNVDVVAEYRSADSGTTRLVTGSVAVKTAPAGTPEVTLLTLPGRLNDGQEGQAMVRVANPTAFVYRQVSVSALNDDDVDVIRSGPPGRPFTDCPRAGPRPGSSEALACLDRLMPGEVQLLGIRVRAHKSVRTGKQRVGVVLSGSLYSTATDQSPPTTVVATGDVELTVFGVDALSPFGIGTLFVLPGLIAVVVLLLLARSVYPRAPSLPDVIELKDLRALPIIVPLAVVAYLIMWLAWGRDLTQTVSTLDVGLLFVVGFIMGLTVWVLIASLWWWHSGRKVFAVGDSCPKVLTRLRARGARLTLPEFSVHGMRYLYLAPADGGKVLACPAIAYAFTPRMDNDERGRAAFQEAVGSDDISAVRRAERRGQVTFGWSAPTGVAALNAADVTTTCTGHLLEEGAMGARPD
jgi:hypothetical protein